MIPVENFNTGIKVVKFKSKSYKINYDKQKIKGIVDELESVKQAVYKILMTDRYCYEIYDWNYGIELNDLIGKKKEYVEGEIIDRISDALLTDDRITEVFDFIFSDIDKTSLGVEFKIKTDFGDADFEVEVKI